MYNGQGSQNTSKRLGTRAGGEEGRDFNLNPYGFNIGIYSTVYTVYRGSAHTHTNTGFNLVLVFGIQFINIFNFTELYSKKFVKHCHLR